MLATVIPTRRALHEQLIDRLREGLHRRRGDALQGLDRRTLADIGVDVSEFASIEAEAHGSAGRTRRRIVVT